MSRGPTDPSGKDEVGQGTEEGATRGRSDVRKDKEKI